MKTLTDRITDRWGRWVVPYAALWITMLIGGVIVVTLAFLGAEVYDDVVDEADLANLDKPALALSEDLRTPWLNSAVTAFTNIGGGIGMPIVGSILTAWLTWAGRTWRPLILVGGAAAASVTATTFGKKLLWPHPPGPCGRCSALRRFAVVPQRAHAQHHRGDRAGGISGLPADPADRCPGVHDHGRCDLHHRHGPEQGVPRPSLADGCHRRVAPWPRLGGNRDPGPQALPCHTAPRARRTGSDVRPPVTPGRTGRAPRHPRGKPGGGGAGPRQEADGPRGGDTTAG